MYKLMILLFLSSLLSSCFDTPRDRRASFQDRNQNQGSSAYPDNRPTGGAIILPGGSGGNTTGTNGSNGDNGGGTEDPLAAIPEQIRHCQWSADGVNGFAQNHNHLGQFTICQSSQKDVDIHLQIKTPITDANLCVFPTYHSGSSSVYIGEPRCFSATNPKTIYKVVLLKNRPNYGHLSVTGVMVMKDKAFFYPPPFYQYVLSPDAYMFCSQFLDTYQDPSYCNAFKNVGQYVYVQF